MTTDHPMTTAAPPTPKPLPTDPAAVAARVSEEESADE